MLPIYSLRVTIQLLNLRQVRVTSAVNKLPCGRNLPKPFEGQSTGYLADFWRPALSLARTFARFRKLKIARNGLHLGTFKKKRFEPSFALGLALKPSQVEQSVEIAKKSLSSMRLEKPFSWQKVCQMVGTKFWLKAMAWALQRLLEMF